jgi:hypothetical protein
MSNLPARLPDPGRPSRALSRAARATERTELAIYKHHLTTRYEAACDEADTQALADASETALVEEMRVMDNGLRLAGNSPAKKELVARMVAQQSNIDLHRIGRRFGR